MCINIDSWLLAARPSRMPPHGHVSARGCLLFMEEGNLFSGPQGASHHKSWFPRFAAIWSLFTSVCICVYSYIYIYISIHKVRSGAWGALGGLGGLEPGSPERSQEAGSPERSAPQGAPKKPGSPERSQENPRKLEKTVSASMLLCISPHWSTSLREWIFSGSH